MYGVGGASVRAVTVAVLACLLAAAGLTGWGLLRRPVARAIAPVPAPPRTARTAAGNLPEVPRPVERLPAPAADHPAHPPFGLQAHLDYIRRAQRPTGAIALTPDSDYINPYFANLAATALLHDPAHLPVVQRWMDWYLDHLNPDGTIDDHRVHPDGHEDPLGQYDSGDSYAATLLSLVRAYLDAGGDLAWVERRRADLDRVAAVMTNLTDDDGLTWAKARYPLKLLMDNSEVYRGWSDWSMVLGQLGDWDAAHLAHRRAVDVQKGIARFGRNNGLHAWAVAPLGIRRGSDPRRFYPDGVAQFFPLAFGMTDDPGGYDAFYRAHSDWTRLEKDQFPWMMAAYAAVRAGDLDSARQAVATAAERFADFKYPWYIAESAWVIRVLAAGVPEPGAPPESGGESDVP